MISVIVVFAFLVKCFEDVARREVKMKRRRESEAALPPALQPDAIDFEPS